MAEINLHLMGDPNPIFEWAADAGDRRLDIEIRMIEPDNTERTQLVSIAIPKHRGGIIQIKRARLT